MTVWSVIFMVYCTVQINQVTSCLMKDVDRGENRDMKKESEENEDTEMAGI